MGKLYFIFSSYTPNNAPINRFLSFVDGFSRLGVDVNVVFILSDRLGSRIAKSWPHITITYLWEHLDWRNRYLRQLSYTILAKRFVRQLVPGDKVVVFDAQRMLFYLLKKKGISVFTERTEHPFAYSVRTIDMNKYVHKCKFLDGLFVISTSLKDYFINQGVPANKIHIINMTVDALRFDEIKKQQVQSPYIAYCGTASNNKDGVNELIKAFSIVVKHYPDYKLLIIGKGLTKDDESGNRQLVESLQIVDKVVFTGIVPSDQMPQLLKNAEILALDRPDNLQAKYGFPTKLGEYLLTENPVVVTSVGDIPLFLKDRVNALLAKPQNPEDFAAKLIWAIEHPKEANIIGKTGADVARKHFNNITESKKMYSIITNNVM